MGFLSLQYLQLASRCGIDHTQALKMRMVIRRWQVRTMKTYAYLTNGRLRDECLNVNQFPSLEHAREHIEQRRVDYK
jgi:hypothetical protein